MLPHRTNGTELMGGCRKTRDTVGKEMAMRLVIRPNVNNPGLITGLRRHGTRRRAEAPALLLGHLTDQARLV